MPINYTNSELQFSGTVTQSEWQNATSTAGLSRGADGIYVLQSNIRFLSGVNIDQWQNYVININDKEFYFEQSGLTLKNLTLIEGGDRAVIDRSVFRIAGSGDLPNLSNIQFIHNMIGNSGSGDSRYLTQLDFNGAASCVFRASDFSEQEIDALSFSASDTYEGISGVRVKRFMVEGTRVILKNCSQSSKLYSTGGLFGVYGGASLIVSNFDKTVLNAGAQNLWLDNYNGQVNNHWLYLLGSAKDIYQSNGAGISDKKTQLHIVVGGHKFYTFINGDGGKFAYFDSRHATNPQKCVPTFNNSEMLETDTIIDIDSTENVEFITQSMTYNYDTGSWLQTNIGSQKFRVRKYGYSFIEQTFSDVDAVEGTSDSFSPTNLLIDAAITETNQSTVSAYTGISISSGVITLTSGSWTPQKLYDYIKYWLSQNMLIAEFGGLNGVTMDIGSYDLVIDGCDLIGGGDISVIQTTGLITVQNSGTIQIDFLDSVGDAIVNFHTPVNWSLQGIYTNENDALNETSPIGSNVIFKYLSTTNGGNMIVSKITKDGGGGSAIESYVLPATRGIYNSAVVVATDDSLLDVVNATTRDTKNIVTEIQNAQLTEDEYDEKTDKPKIL